MKRSRCDLPKRRRTSTTGLVRLQAWSGTLRRASRSHNRPSVPRPPAQFGPPVRDRETTRTQTHAIVTMVKPDHEMHDAAIQRRDVTRSAARAPPGRHRTITHAQRPTIPRNNSSGWRNDTRSGTIGTPHRRRALRCRARGRPQAWPGPPPVWSGPGTLGGIARKANSPSPSSRAPTRQLRRPLGHDWATNSRTGTPAPRK
jgi:hypothetical protein